MTANLKALVQKWEDEARKALLYPITQTVIRRLADELTREIERMESEPRAQEWRPIETAPHRMSVLVAYRNKLNKWRVVKACYYPEGTLEWDDNDGLYYALGGDSEESFAPAGWYECSEVHDHILPTDEPPIFWHPIPYASLPDEPENPMTLTQELAQALRECAQLKCQHYMSSAGAGLIVKTNVPWCAEFTKAPKLWCATCKARAALARYDAEPPTSRGSEGEAKPVAWLIHTQFPYLAFEPVEGSTIRRTALYASPPSSHPSPEAWRQAVREHLVYLWREDDRVRTLTEIESRAAEIHAASCAGVKSANSSQSEKPRS